MTYIDSLAARWGKAISEANRAYPPPNELAQSLDAAIEHSGLILSEYMTPKQAGAAMLFVASEMAPIAMISNPTPESIVEVIAHIGYALYSEAVIAEEGAGTDGTDRP